MLNCKNCEEEKRLLERVDQILRVSGVEAVFVERSVELFEVRAKEGEGRKASERGNALERHIRHSHLVLRCTVLRHLRVCSFPEMSKALALTPLYRRFRGCEDFEVIQVPGKSTLRDYAHWLSAVEMEKILGVLWRAVTDEERAREIGLEAELDLAVAWVDSTCLKACIHFPTDWVLMRDAVRTLCKSILVIRRHGLKRRIAEPESFLREVNALSMGMGAAARRKAGGKKERKRILRVIKKVSTVVEEHARRYREALDTDWSETDLTRKEAEVTLRRMDRVLDQLPEARRQAHERIIGERKIENADKILSLYDPDVHVIVRGKAGANVEFGNSLFLAENAEGFIIDREKCAGALAGIVGDRGFESHANVRMLESDDVFNGLCPRNPHELSRRMAEDEVFAAAAVRRSQTEARIGILKNDFLGSTPLAKGFENRQIQVAWAVLAHNLWVLARQPRADNQRQPLAEAA